MSKCFKHILKRNMAFLAIAIAMVNFVYPEAAYPIIEGVILEDIDADSALTIEAESVYKIESEGRNESATAAIGPEERAERITTAIGLYREKEDNENGGSGIVAEYVFPAVEQVAAEDIAEAVSISEEVEEYLAEAPENLVDTESAGEEAVGDIVKTVSDSEEVAEYIAETSEESENGQLVIDAASFEAKDTPFIKLYEFRETPVLEYRSSETSSKEYSLLTNLGPGLYNEDFELISTWEELTEKHPKMLGEGGRLTSQELYGGKKVSYLRDEAGKLVIPDSVTSFDSDAFTGCDMLTCIIFSDRVSSGLRFDYCGNLTHIGIPYSVLVNIREPFKAPESLTDITVSAINYVPKTKPEEFYSLFAEEKAVTLNIAQLGTLANGAFKNVCWIGEVNLLSTVTYLPEFLFSGCQRLQKVVMKENVKGIGRECFADCRTLHEITLGSKITALNSGTFLNCEELTAVKLPDGMKTIGDKAFKGCSSLESLSIPSSVTDIGKSAFSGCSMLKTMKLPKQLKELGERTFENCSALTGAEIPSGISSLTYTFAGCTSLKTYTIPKNVKYLYATFENCTSLESVSLHSSLVDMSEAFSGCSALTQVTIPSGVVGIAKAFMNCASLKKITVPGSVETIDKSFYGCTSLEKVTIEAGVKQITNAGFKDCVALREISLPESLTGIGAHSFQNCQSLLKIEIPKDVKKLADSAFEGCAALTEIKGCKGLEIIENNVFENCGALERMPKLEKLKSIKNEAFKSCAMLTEISFGEGISEIPNFCFYECTGLKKVGIPQSVTAIGYHAFEECVSLEAVILPEKLDAIYTHAFMNCTALKSVSIPESVRYIYSYAFFGCTGMKELILPDSPAILRGYAFGNCSGLTALIIPEKLSRRESLDVSGNVTGTTDCIDPAAFAGCTGLKKIEVEETNPVYQSPNGCNAILCSSNGIDADILLLGCENTVIPESVKTISEYAFGNPDAQGSETAE